MKTIAVIIVNWNGKDDTIECLSSINKLSYDQKKYEIFPIVIDNGSQDNSVKIIKEKFSNIKILESSENLGFAAGNNLGIKYALLNNSDLFLLINNDTILDKNIISNLSDEIDNCENKEGIIAPKIYFAPGYEYHLERYKKNELGNVFWYAGGIIDWNNMICSHRGVDEVDIGQYNTKKETDFASGCCMLIKKEIVEKIGLFDKKYFMYLEDVDYCLRVKKAGYKIIYQPKAIIWHKNASSSGKPGSTLHNYYLTRNRLIFGMKYASLRTKLALIKESLRVFKRNLPGERQAVIDFFLGKTGKSNKTIYTHLTPI